MFIPMHFVTVYFPIQLRDCRQSSAEYRQIMSCSDVDSTVVLSINSFEMFDSGSVDYWSQYKADVGTLQVDICEIQNNYVDQKLAGPAQVRTCGPQIYDDRSEFYID